MATLTGTTGWTWSPAVHAFADEEGVTPYLEPVLALTRRLFPGRVLRASVEADGEIPGERYLAIDVDIAGLEADAVVAARRLWDRELAHHCPRDLRHSFYLGIVGGA